MDWEPWVQGDRIKAERANGAGEIFTDHVISGGILTNPAILPPTLRVSSIVANIGGWRITRDTEDMDLTAYAFGGYYVYLAFTRTDDPLGGYLSVATEYVVRSDALAAPDRSILLGWIDHQVVGMTVRSISLNHLGHAARHRPMLQDTDMAVWITAGGNPAVRAIKACVREDSANPADLSYYGDVYVRVYGQDDFNQADMVNDGLWLAWQSFGKPSVPIQNLHISASARLAVTLRVGSMISIRCADGALYDRAYVSSGATHEHMNDPANWTAWTARTEP